MVLYSVGLLFGSLRDRKIFLEIVTETIKREGSITGISGIPCMLHFLRLPISLYHLYLFYCIYLIIELIFITDQAAASEEPEAPKDREEIQRELARRGVSMPNIILPGMRGGEGVCSACVVPGVWCERSARI